MVSCGSCARWQHITCHDFADSNAGYPKRNWDVQQFICQRCRSARMARINNGHDRNQPVDQHTWSQSSPQRVPPSHPANYIQPTAESRYPQQPTFDARATYSQQTQQQYGRGGGSVLSTRVFTAPGDHVFALSARSTWVFSDNGLDTLARRIHSCGRRAPPASNGTTTNTVPRADSVRQPCDTPLSGK